MKVIETKIKDLYILEPDVFGDPRGWFMETWSKRHMEEAGLFYSFVQDNQSFSAKKGTLRGLHYQKGDASQAKLVRCQRGAVLDVAVDLRKDQPTFKQWVAVELSALNKRQFLIPRGFAHGFITLTDDVEFAYKADNYYEPDQEVSILWNDKEIGIDWGTNTPMLSKKDESASPFTDETFVF